MDDSGASLSSLRDSNTPEQRLVDAGGDLRVHLAHRIRRLGEEALNLRQLRDDGVRTRRVLAVGTVELHRRLIGDEAGRDQSLNLRLQELELRGDLLAPGAQLSRCLLHLGVGNIDIRHGGFPICCQIAKSPQGSQCFQLCVHHLGVAEVITYTLAMIYLTGDRH